MSTKDADRLKVYVILKNEWLQKFREVKQYLKQFGIERDTEVVRASISQFWKQIQKEKQETN